MAYNMLIVDDSDFMRRIILRIVKVGGIPSGEVYEASDGDEALDILSRSPVDIVIADLNMPVMSGTELIGEMRRRGFGRVPVVVVSTEGRPDRIETVMREGAKGFLTKPFRPEEAAALISGILGVKADERIREDAEEGDF